LKTSPMPVLNPKIAMNKNKMSTDIPLEEFQQIEQVISSDESVVGIDAKKTHIIIIHMLKEIQNKLDDLESRLDTIEKNL
jgi:hypothetical protein